MLLAPCIYAGRLGLTAWRRKSTIIIGVLLLVLIIFGVHYNVGLGLNSADDMPQKDSLISTNTFNGIPHIIALGEDFSKRKNHVDMDSNSVQFVQNQEDKNGDNKFLQTEPPLMLDGKDLQNLEQPSRDEISKRRIEGEFNDQGSFDNYANQGINQMGIPYVNLDTKNPYIPAKRVVHLDLKGAPPKVSYLKRLFPLLKTLGATSLLLEYEDMFPFTGNLAEIAAHNAYTREQLLEILRSAKDNELEVIPLVQTFGHLEFALKREGFVHLREVPESPQALCPSLNQSLDFVESMINQVLELHGNDVRFLHVGCDEVFQMGACARCRRGARDPLFLKHVRAVASRVSRRWPHVRPLVWDDMLRHVPQRDLMDSGIGQYVDPMVWVYAEDIYRFVPTHVWDKYSSVFSTVWSASAFKGAFGETEYVPNAKRHLENNLRWLEVMSEEAPKFKNGFAGIVLTGWQRYDHFAILCELLPAAIPSLAISLTATSHGHFDASMADTVGAVLGCPSPSPPHMRLRSPSQPLLSLNTDPHMWDKFGRCFFPGNSFFKLTYRLHVAEAEVKEFLEQVNRLKGWMTPYNIRHNYSAPLRVTELTSDLPRLQRGLSSLARAAVDALSDVCDVYTIAEWVEQRIYPDILALEKVQVDSQSLLNRRTWEKRPLPPLEDLRRFGVVMPEAERH